MHRVSAPVAPPSWTSASTLTFSKYSTKLAWSRPPGASPHLLDHGLQLYLQTRSITASMVPRSWPASACLQTRSITASKCICKPARWRPPGASPDLVDSGLQLFLQSRFIEASKFARSLPPSAYLQTCSITASQCISILRQSLPPNISPNIFHYGLQVHLQTWWIIGSECISEFTRSWCGEMVVLDGWHPIINTLPHLAWHTKGIHGNERFLPEERRKWVRQYDGIPGHDEPHKLCGSMNAWKQCMRNHTNCVGLWKLGRSAWDQELGKIVCVFCTMRWCLSTTGSTKYILPVAESISICIYTERLR